MDPQLNNDTICLAWLKARLYCYMKKRHETVDNLFCYFYEKFLWINGSTFIKSIIINVFSCVCLLLMTYCSQTTLSITQCFNRVMRLAQQVEKISRNVLILGHKFSPVRRPTVIAKAELQQKMLNINLSQYIRIQDRVWGDVRV